MNNTSKKIILTDYKNYKKFKNNHLLVNGYNFEKDIRSFLVKYFIFSDKTKCQALFMIHFAFC